MKLPIILFFCIILMGGRVFSNSTIDAVDYAKVITIDGRDYVATSTNSGLVFFPVNQAVKIIKSIIGIRGDATTKDSILAEKSVEKTVNVSKSNGDGKDSIRVLSGDSILSGTVIEVLPRTEYLVIQRAIRNHKRALDLIAKVIQNNAEEKSFQNIKKIHTQTTKTLRALESELKRPIASKTEIKNTILLIQKQIKQMQSELKKLDK